VPKPPPEAPIITIVDYGAGNLHSVRRALESVGQRPLVTSDPREVDRAKSVVFPGVGSANDAMKALRTLGLVEPLREYAASGRPFLGVCVGLQLLYDWSEEGGGTECLGILSGTVRRFPSGELKGSHGVPGDAMGTLKVPHLGWNTVSLRFPHPLVEGLPDGGYFYFVHSYYAAPLDPETVLGQTDYGLDFASIVAQDNVLATQFHPEKSAALGLRLYANFAAIAAAERAQATVG
jgi:imidazole glycerol-phosphate synthase subunit HisH